MCEVDVTFSVTPDWLVHPHSDSGRPAERTPAVRRPQRGENRGVHGTWGAVVGGVMVSTACAYRCFPRLECAACAISVQSPPRSRRCGSRRVDRRPRCQQRSRGCGCQGTDLGQPRNRCSSNPAPHSSSEHAWQVIEPRGQQCGHHQQVARNTSKGSAIVRLSFHD